MIRRATADNGPSILATEGLMMGYLYFDKCHHCGSNTAHDRDTRLPTRSHRQSAFCNAAQDALRLRGIQHNVLKELLSLEWRGGASSGCPSCGSNRPAHLEDCTLSKSIDELCSVLKISERPKSVEELVAQNANGAPPKGRAP